MEISLLSYVPYTVMIRNEIVANIHLHIVQSSDEELEELLQAAQSTSAPLRFELKQPNTVHDLTSGESVVDAESLVSQPPSHVKAAIEQVEKKIKVEQDEEEWTRVNTLDRSTPVLETVETPKPVEVEPTTPTLLFEDPDETPLPTTSTLAQEQAAQEFPSSSTSSSSALPDSFPDDPLEVPLPTSHDALPFSNLPNSLSSFLSSLGTRSTTFSYALASALSPTSPHSPTSRLSSVLSASSLDDIPLVASSLVQMGSEFAEIAKDVAMGVRREAEEIRGEFGKLREEVERERSRFREEIRGAIGQAAIQEENIELNEQAPKPSSSSTSAPPPAPASSTSAGSSDSVRSATSPSAALPHALYASSSSSPAVTRETARLLQKQAKQARKDYRAAVRRAREEKKIARSERSVTVESGIEGNAKEFKIPGGMPSNSSVAEESSEKV